MADKKKTETKSKKKSADTKSADTKSDSGAGTDTKSTDTKSKGYNRGENQKPVTEDYRNNWDQIFGKKKSSGRK